MRRGLLDVLSKLVEDGRWLRKAVSETVEDVCEHVDVVHLHEADVEKTNKGTEGRAHAPHETLHTRNLTPPGPLSAGRTMRRPKRRRDQRLPPEPRLERLLSTRPFGRRTA